MQVAKLKDTWAVACHAMLCLLYNNPILGLSCSRKLNKPKCTNNA